MSLAPLPDPGHLVGSLPIIAVGGAVGPSPLVGGLPGLLALGLGAEPLMITVVRIGKEQLLTMRTVGPAVQNLHVAPRGVLPPEENGKPVPQNYALRSTTIPKKEEEIRREEPEENRSRKCHPFRRPALGTFQKTAANPQRRRE